LAVFGGRPVAKVVSKSDCSLLELLQTQLNRFKTAESGAFFSLDSREEDGQGLVAEVNGGLAQGVGQVVEGLLFGGCCFKVFPNSSSVAASLPEVPGIKGDIDVVGGLAQEEFTGPAFGWGLNEAQPFGAPVDTSSVFPCFKQSLADVFTLFLEMDGLHLAEGAEAFGRFEEAAVENGRFAVEASAGFPVAVG
jgi:hypothetical protein